MLGLESLKSGSGKGEDGILNSRRRGNKTEDFLAERIVLYIIDENKSLRAVLYKVL
jgi:hypothetical protein